MLFFNESASSGRSGGQPGQTNNSDQQDTVTHILGLNASTRFAIGLYRPGGLRVLPDRHRSAGASGGDDEGTSHTVFASVARQFGLYTTAGISTSFQYQVNDSTKIYNASLFGAYGLPTGYP